MKNIIPSMSDPLGSHTHANSTAQVIDLAEEQKLAREVEGLIELHDFIKAHPDAPVKEIAKFMPPVDARVVNKAIQALAIRDKNLTPEQKDAIMQRARLLQMDPKVKKWGR
jgi:ABC-type nitrate/sulfonate/bicarbonate transport system substrate-binding protein